MKTFEANIVDIRRERIFFGSIEVSRETGRIGRITEAGSENPSAPYILPGFIDSHIHIESTLLTPENYAPLAAAHGVTGAVCDPHEIANVLGVEGVEFMLESASKVRFNFHFAASPCVPGTSFEHSGAALGPSEVEALLQRDEIYGLGEMMNVPGLVAGDPDVLAKIRAAKDAGKPIDGHMAGAPEEWVKKCAEAGICTDHESMDIDDALLKLKHGLSILIREGSAACNYNDLSPLLADGRYSGKLMFCSDDKYADELLEGEYIDGLVRESVRRGYPLWTVLRAACINPVETYGLSDGTLRKGDRADFIVVDNLKDFRILEAFVGGEKAGEKIISAPLGSALPNNFKAGKLLPEDMAVKAVSEKIRVIKINDGQLVTEALECKARIEDGQAVSDIQEDILKVIVYNRYTPGAKPSVAFVRGFGLKGGAIASSIGHDSHNITALGTSDSEIAAAVNAIVETGGGMSVSVPGKGTVVLPLPVAGLMSGDEGHEVAAGYHRIKDAISAIGCPLKAPLMTMAFLSLPVIPALKLTDASLFDVVNFTPCDLFL